MNEFREQLILAAEKGDLLKEIFKIRGKIKSNNSLLKNEIIELHKEGIIDVILEFSKIKKDSSGYNVSSLKTFFDSILAELDKPIAEIIECYHLIINSIGYSKPSKLIYESLINYLVKDRNRIDLLLTIVIEDKELNYIDYLASALLAGISIDKDTYFTKTLQLLKSKNKEIILKSIFTLGIIDYKNSTSDIENVIKEFNLKINNTFDDLIFSSIVDSTIKLLRKHREFKKQFESILIKTMDKNGSKIMFSHSNVFGFNIEIISEKLRDKLIEYLRQVEPKDLNSLSNIGYGLTHLLESDKNSIVLNYLENVLTVNEGKIRIEHFDSLLDHLLYCKSEKINYIITRWFYSNNIHLYKAVEDIFSNDTTNRIFPEVDISQIDKKPTKQIIFLAKKAVGWLFFNAPEKSTHFILSLIPICNHKDIKELQKILMYPILLNYPGKITKYLKKIKQEKPKLIQDVIESSIKELESYQNSIKDCFNINELMLPPSYVEVYRRYDSQKMSDMYEEALKKSIFSIFQHEKSSHINLYGNKILQQTVDTDGNISRHSIPFIKRRHSFEFPWLSYIDPTGLELLLYEYRKEERII